MAASSAFVPIIVAVIGVLGAVIPAVYVNSLQSQPDPNLTISALRVPLPVPNVSQFLIFVDNEAGNAPATNLSLILEPVSVSTEILSITNLFSTTDVILPQYNNTRLEPRSEKIINHSPLEIEIPKLVHGAGSVVRLAALANYSEYLDFFVYAVYDQGSEVIDLRNGSLSAISTDPTFNLTKVSEEYARQAQIITSTFFTPWLVIYYVIFFGFFGFVALEYYHRRKRFNLLHITENIMSIRKRLRVNPKYNVNFETWEIIPDVFKDMNDYLIIDDFYSEVKKRNQYLRDMDKEKSDLSRTNALSKLNEALLASAENVLNKVDWNKYR